MKNKMIIPIVIILTVVVIGFSYFKPKKTTKGFVEKSISQNEAIQFLNYIDLEKSVLPSDSIKREVYNDMGIPSDGERYIVLKLKDGSLKNLTNTYNINREKDSEGNLVLLKEISKDEALKKLEDYSNNDKLLKMINSDFNSKKGNYFIK